jgi:hypothetical protein
MDARLGNGDDEPTSHPTLAIAANQRATITVESGHDFPLSERPAVMRRLLLGELGSGNRKFPAPRPRWATRLWVRRLCR